MIMHSTESMYALCLACKMCCQSVMYLYLFSISKYIRIISSSNLVVRCVVLYLYLFSINIT
jgi:hypothetical protein